MWSGALARNSEAAVSLLADVIGFAVVMSGAGMEGRRMSSIATAGWRARAQWPALPAESLLKFVHLPPTYALHLQHTHTTARGLSNHHPALAIISAPTCHHLQAFLLRATPILPPSFRPSVAAHHHHPLPTANATDRYAHPLAASRARSSASLRITDR